MSTLFSGHYLRNRSTLDIGVLGYIGIVQHKEHSPELLSLPPGTPCIPLPYTYKNKSAIMPARLTCATEQHIITNTCGQPINTQTFAHKF